MNLRQPPRNATVIQPRTALCGHIARPTARKSLSDCKSARQPHERGFPSGGIDADMVGYGKRQPGAARFKWFSTCLNKSQSPRCESFAISA